METTTWMFFIFNCLVALWAILHPIILSGKDATMGKRVSVVAIGVIYGVIVVTAMNQVINTGGNVSSYL